MQPFDFAIVSSREIKKQQHKLAINDKTINVPKAFLLWLLVRYLNF